MMRILFVISMMLFFLARADARPRDDVMAGLYHCNGLAGDRQWLDCFYGAAQPARANLGLKPALPSQVQLAQSLQANSRAQPSALRSRVVADAGRCYDQGDDQEWLGCYYRAAIPMREQLGLPSPSTQSNAFPSQIDRFGLKKVAETPPRQDTGDSIQSRMLDYSFDGQAIFTVRLENGQTWRQIDGDSHFARWRKSPDTYLVTIRHGMSRSFVMTVLGEPRVFKVHRIN